MVAAKSLQNLSKRKRFGKEQPPLRNGRPPNLDYVQAFREHMAKGNRVEQLLETLRKKKPVEAMYYLAGKPKEMIQIDASVKAEITQQEVINKAQAIRAELEKGAKK